jgi:hypothetical protein
MEIVNQRGREPRWRKDGKELFYLEPDRLKYRLMYKNIPGIVKAIPGSGETGKKGVPQGGVISHPARVARRYSQFATIHAAFALRLRARPQGKHFRGHLCVYFRYGPMARHHPKDDAVNRFQEFGFPPPCFGRYPYDPGWKSAGRSNAPLGRPRRCRVAPLEAPFQPLQGVTNLTCTNGIWVLCAIHRQSLATHFFTNATERFH